MLAREAGVCAGSDYFFSTPSELACEVLYYMTSCGAFYTDYNYRIEREDYHNYMVFYLCAGRLSVTSEGRTMVAEPGQVGFINCHLPHEYHAIGNAEFIWLHLDGGQIAQIHRRVMSRNEGFVFDIACASAIREQLSEIIYTCRNEQMLSESGISYRIYHMLMNLLDDAAESADTYDGNSSVGLAMQFIRAQYSRKITLEDVARSANMSQYHFARLFKKSCGYSPHEFIILTRLNHAKHLLKTTDLPIKTIAQDVGYQDMATFSNAFASRVGLSPSAFRKYPI